MIVICALRMLVARVARAQLGLENGTRDSGRMLEHEIAPATGGNEKYTHASDRRDEREQALAIPHARFAKDPPQGEHAKDAERDQGELLVTLHHLVNRSAVRDTFLRLKAGEHRRDGAHRARQQGPEPYLAKHRPPAAGAEQIEDDRGQKEGGW
jgi:hypothetical protein